MIEKNGLSIVNSYESLGLEQSGDFDKPREECGVVGVWLSNQSPNIAGLIGDGLETLQHRGQEAAGVAVCSNLQQIDVLKDVGLVKEVMGGRELEGLPDGNIAVGHVRYGTVGVHSKQASFDAAGPALTETKYGSIAVGHNGHILNVDRICAKFGVDSSEHVTDSGAMTAAVGAVRANCSSLPEAVRIVFSEAEEAYSIAVMGEGQLIALRDPFGFRPLMLGTYENNGGYAIASETPAIKAMGARYRREIARGEMLVCNTDGTLTSTFPFPEKLPKLCAFEYIYFSAPHGELEGRSVHMVRKEMGRILARECPADADVVVGVPESGISGAEGYSQESGIPRVSGLIKNRYLGGRTFILPDQQSREAAVRRKLSVMGPEIYQKKLVVVDDSIVRGTTTKAIVAMLREQGALEIHLRITSAPYKWPCFYGMDTSDPKELIANQIPILKELEEYLEVESLGYLSLPGLRAAASDAAGKLCMACMDGKYPTAVPLELISG